MSSVEDVREAFDVSLLTGLRQLTDPADLEEVVDYLCTERFESTPRHRVHTLVEAAMSRVDETSETPALSQPESTTEMPRERQSRYADVADLAYLTATELSLVLGVVLEQFGGSSRQAARGDDLVVDLFWNRTHDTVALTAVPQHNDEAVGIECIKRVAGGRTRPTKGRAPSTLAVVTNGRFSEAAQSAAADHDIVLLDQGHLVRWLQVVQLTPEVFGTILEEGEQQDVELEETLETMAEPPTAVTDAAPFEMAAVESATEVETSTTLVPESNPVGESPTPPGEHGVLYADPAEDGDYGAFDRFIDRIGEGDDQ